MIFRLVDDRTRVVALSHVEYWNGFRADLAAIGAECRRRGVIFSVDAIQSVGAVQVDVASMNIDHLSAGAYKWLLGPVGMGFAYIHPDLIERLRPPLVGWGTMVPTSSPSQYRVEFQHSAKRFEESIISLLDIAAFQASVDLILDLGPAAIEDRVLALSQRLSGGLASRGLEVVEPWPRSRTEASGIVSFRRSGTVAADLLAVLTAGGVEGRVHDDFVRLAPHFYNTEIEIDRVLELVS
jgi:selenocysteine lyase/cysteine desulfurase